ncbi:MAG: hypothetical protein QG656_1163, partial [Candidatus Hydrogenedentes bacterium]|nr:hypothetical protein [Candidatus Hydrogenedentota bacterium]
GVKQAFVHPRPGLMTPYLSPDWFRLWKAALDEAERLDMNIWIYDENSYPSGFAGGFVPEAMPESRGRGLTLHESKLPGKVNGADVAIFNMNMPDGAFVNITEQVRMGKDFPEGRYLTASVKRSGPSPWFGGKWYVDLLYPGVTEKFLEITMDAYKREVGDQFGKRLPGAFTDEPHLSPAGGFHWTEDLPQAFEKRWGYSLVDQLPGLQEEVGDWRRVRHNYFQLLLELFIDRWAKPYFEYCGQNDLEFTGHYWEHSWPECGSAPDNMAMYAWHQRPSIDTLFNQYDEGVHSQFGNVRAVIELTSVANQMGVRRTLCEAYGGGGWDMRFEDMKRIGDWLYVLGVNTLDQHLSHNTIRGARKRDYPPTFSYHSPWWNAYHVSADYFTRLSLALSSGEQVNRILVLEPTTTVWMYQATQGDKREAIGNAFQQVVTDLAKSQAEFDIGCEDIMARNGSVEGKQLRVGKRLYDTVVVPPMTENLNVATLTLLDSYLSAGGTVLGCGPAALAFVDGQASDRAAALAKNAGWRETAPEALAAALLERSDDGFAVRRAEGDAGILYHHRRCLDDGDLLFLVNTSITEPTKGTVESRASGVQEWNAETGAVSPHPFAKADQGVRVDFDLPPCGSLLLFLSNQPGEPMPAPSAETTALAASGPIEVHRAASNVLTLDYVDVTAGGETKTAVHFYQANQFVFRQNGEHQNPWDHAVQFRDELIAKKFPPESGFEASYRFVIEENVPASLFIVIERPDLYAIACNGTPVAAAAGAWWLDKAFGKIDIAPVAIAGENVVTIKASPFTMFHELESAYVIGEFALKATDKGFSIVPEGALTLGPWKEQGLPLYGHGVTYTQTFDVAQPAGRYEVFLPNWYGSVAEVTVNGKPAGYIHHAPWTCDVTSLLAAGPNTVAVTVIGTLKNQMGPHHGKPPLGFAGPGSFHNAPTPGPPPGAQYDTVAYGMFAPFELMQGKP